MKPQGLTVYSVTLQALAHEALRRALRNPLPLPLPQGGDKEAPRAVFPLAVDGTAGNGHDALFLAQCVGEGGTVWAFDVQETALTATRTRLEAAQMAQRVRCVLDGHEHLERHLPPQAVIHGAMFNLGYLPGEPRNASAPVVTRPETTLTALGTVLQRMASGGVLSVHIYTGHEGGEEECATLLQWAVQLPHPQWQVLHTCTSNKPLRAEHLLLIART